MPEMRFHVRWPDDTTTACYSPSLVIKDFFRPGQRYPLPDFLARSRAALEIERVRQKYGMGCAHAARQLEEIESLASRFTEQRDAQVLVEAFEE